MGGSMCVLCKKRRAGKAEYIEFEYKDPKRILFFPFKFKIFKQGMFCQQCEEKEHIKKFTEHGRRLIVSDIDGWRVQWGFYIQYRKDRGGRASSL